MNSGTLTARKIFSIFVSDRIYVYSTEKIGVAVPRPDVVLVMLGQHNARLGRAEVYVALAPGCAQGRAVRRGQAPHNLTRGCAGCEGNKIKM
jgi:hypothetical protein